MKMFQLPVSDCDAFVAGVIDGTCFEPDIDGASKPKHGIIIWYRSQEACKAALRAAVDAHWIEDQSAAGTMTAPTVPASDPSA